MPFDSTNYRMANTIVGGELDAILARYRDEGLALNAISSRLYAEHHVEVSHQTVSKWLGGLETEAKAS